MSDEPKHEKKILHTVKQSDDGVPSRHPDFVFWCPGCKCGHAVWTTKANSGGAQWSFNGNMDRPTFSPSLLITRPEWHPPVTPDNLEQWRANPWPQTQITKVCHSFIVDGQIQFLPDCTHELAGKTVPMEAF